MKKALAILVIISVVLGSLCNVYVFGAENGNDIMVAFDEDYLKFGDNTYKIYGTNSSAETLSFRTMAAIYTDGVMISSVKGTQRSIAPGAEFCFEESVFAANTVDLANSRIYVYVIDNMNTMRPLAQQFGTNGKQFSYTLTEDASTSAGVYTTDDILIRTLWSARKDEAGVNFGIWDGKDDYGSQMPSGDYKVKVLSNNVNYEIDTVVGSNGIRGDRSYMMNGYYSPCDMAYVNGKMYYGDWYSEGFGIKYFDVSNPLVREGLIGKPGMTVQQIATDGKSLYVKHSVDAKYSETDRRLIVFMYGVDLATGTQLKPEYSEIVPNGFGSKLYNGIAPMVVTETEGMFTQASGRGGIDVQENGNFLVGAYTTLNKVVIVDKLTGETINTLDLDTPYGVAFDQNDDLWLSFKEDGVNVVRRYSIGSGGVLTQNGEISGDFATVLAIDVAPDGKVAIAEGDDRNRISCISADLTRTLWTYGSGESYETDAEVKDDKFLFYRSAGIGDGKTKNRGVAYTFLTFENSDTLWFGDIGNCRSIRLNIKGNVPKIKDKIEIADVCYFAMVNQSDPTRAHHGFREYEIDYSAEDPNASWKLKYNYVLMCSDLFSTSHYCYLDNPTTLSNGLTYFGAVDAEDSVYKLYELTQYGVRSTGITLNDWRMTKDGNIRRLDKGSDYRYLEKKLTGFDADNNPIWGDEEVLKSVPKSAYGQFQGGKAFQANHNDGEYAITDSGLVIYTKYYSVRTADDRQDFRLGAVRVNPDGTADWTFKTMRATTDNYVGDFPKDGYFEVGNGTLNTCTYPRVYGRNIVSEYYGEFYKQGQANEFYHYYDNGLLVGVFGTAIGQRAPYGKLREELFTGNGFNWQFVPIEGRDDMFYIYQGGEASLSGLTRWKVTGLDTIHETVIDIKYNNNMRSGITKSSKVDGISASSPQFTHDFDVSGIVEGETITYEGYITKPSTVTTSAVSFKLITNCNADVTIGTSTVMSGTGVKTASYTMTNDGIYDFKITVTRNSSTSPYLKFYYMNGNTATDAFDYLLAVPQKYEDPRITKTNMLDGLPFDSEPVAGENGWNWDSAVITPKTNAFNYQIDCDNDFYHKTYVKYKAADVIVTKDFPALRPDLKKWTLDSKVITAGTLNDLNEDNSFTRGRVIDILDENGKIIVRFYVGEDYCVYVNDRVIYTAEDFGAYGQVIPEVNIGYIHEFTELSDLSFDVSEYGITATYRGESIDLDCYEEGALWNKPAQLRMTLRNSSTIAERNGTANFITDIGKLCLTQEGE